MNESNSVYLGYFSLDRQSPILNPMPLSTSMFSIMPHVQAELIWIDGMFCMADLSPETSNSLLRRVVQWDGGLINWILESQLTMDLY